VHIVPIHHQRHRLACGNVFTVSVGVKVHQASRCCGRESYVLQARGRTILKH
jgi:hypothetical protein